MIMKYFGHLLRGAYIILEQVSCTKYRMTEFERGLLDLPEVSSKVKDLTE